MRLLRLLLLLLCGAGLGLAVIMLWVRLDGREVLIVAPHGAPTETRLAFAPPADRATRPDGGSEARPPATPLLREDTPTAIASSSPQRRARGVVLVIADGMGISHLFAARAELVGPAGKLFVETLPTTGWLTTYAERSMYTDSAASAAAMATGQKTAPALLALDGDGQHLRTVVEAANEAGLATGLITDSYVLDATPAAFVAHARRRDYGLIAEHVAAAGLDLIAGTVGSEAAWAGTLSSALAENEITVVDDLPAWKITLDASTPVAGLFPSESIADPDRAPSLLDLATSGLARLVREPDGFFLLVETEEVDSGAHRGDLRRVISGIRALDDVVREVVTIARREGDVLVIVTSDHETGGLGLTGGTEGTPMLVRWATSSHTAEPVPVFAFGPDAEKLSGVHDNTDVAHVIAGALGLDLGSLSKPGAQSEPQAEPEAQP